MRTLLPPHCGLWSGSGRTWQSGPSWGMGSWTPCVQEGSSCSTVDLDSDSLYGQGFHKGRNLASSAMQRSVKFQCNTHEWDLSLKVKQYTLQDLSLKVKQSTRFKSKSKTTSLAFMTFHHQLQVRVNAAICWHYYKALHRITPKPISGTVSSDNDLIAQEMSVCQGLTFLFQISVQYRDWLGFQIIITNTSLQKSMWHVCQILLTDKELLTIMDWGQTVTKKVSPYTVIVCKLYTVIFWKLR